MKCTHQQRPACSVVARGERWRVVLLLAVLAQTANATRVDFATVAQKFPPATLPFVIQALGEPGKKLSADEVEALGLSRTTVPQLAPLLAWRSKLKKGQARALYPVAAITRGELKVLALRFDESAPGSERRQTFLLSYDAKGRLVGGLAFHVAEKSEHLLESDVSNLNFIGVASRVRHVTRPLSEPGLPAELTVHSEERAKLTAAGTLEELPPSYLTRSGAYREPTGQELRVFDARVFHRASAGAPFVELEGDGKTVRFPGADKPYLLTWDDRKSAISAQTPEGKVQLFTRSW